MPTAAFDGQHLPPDRLSQGRFGQEQIVGVNELNMAFSDDLVLSPSQDRQPSGIGGEKRPLGIDHRQQVLGVAPQSVAFAGSVRDGLLKREEHPKDRRQVVLLLTAKGRSLWRKISKTYEDGVRQIFGALPAKSRQHFLDDLAVIQDALNRSFPNSEKI